MRIAASSGQLIGKTRYLAIVSATTELILAAEGYLKAIENSSIAGGDDVAKMLKYADADLRLREAIKRAKQVVK